MEPRDVLIVLHGGKNFADAVLRQAVAEERVRGHRIEVLVTWEPGDATRFAMTGAERGVQTIIAAGGDGTLNEVINGIFQAGKLRETSVGLLPLGTGNDFAGMCGFETADVGESLHVSLNAPPTPIDLGLVNGCPFINMATAGFGTDVTLETSEDLKNLFGRAAYLLTGLRKFSNIASRNGALRGPGIEWSGSFYVLAIGNGRQSGGGRVLCPDASLQDGLLDLFVLPELQADQVLHTIPRFMTEGLSAIETEGFRHRASWFEISVPEGLHVNLDGEPIEGTDFRFEIMPAALSFHVQLPQDLS